MLNRDHNWDQHYDLLVEQSIRVLGFFYIGFCCLFVVVVVVADDYLVFAFVLNDSIFKFQQSHIAFELFSHFP